MPLRVHCPNGCLLRMPVSRAGKIVRCPGCKSLLQLGQVSETESKSGKPIPLNASLIEKQSETGAVSSSDSKAEEKVRSARNRSQSHSTPKKKSKRSRPNKQESAIRDAIEAATAEQVPPPQNPGSEKVSRTTEDSSNVHSDSSSKLRFRPADDEPSTTLKPKHQSRLDVPGELSPTGVQQSRQQYRARLRQILAVPDEIPDPKPVTALGQPTPELDSSSSEAPDSFSLLVEISDEIQRTRCVSESASWLERLESANADRRVLARLLAAALCLVAAINLIPAGFYWYDWYRAILASELPRWVYLQCFVAGLYLIYAVFLFQIPDWTALRAVAVATLAIAFLFGLVSTGLLVGGAQGTIAGFLGISFSVIQRAAVWCVAMLCLAVLLCFFGGWESAKWQRSIQLLDELRM